MSGFENYAREAGQLDREIERKGVILGIDWTDEAQVRALAREAIECRMDPEHPECTSSDPKTRARVELFGLAQLMLTVMKESARVDMHTHGGAAWKAFAHALWTEHDLRQRNT
ncbi:MAG: hypothetical protein Q8O52_05365 [Sulfuritalea sp.]|nr:hypothetical protein [Sulfuritalea sp.]